MALEAPIGEAPRWGHQTTRLMFAVIALTLFDAGAQVGEQNGNWLLPKLALSGAPEGLQPACFLDSNVGFPQIRQTCVNVDNYHAVPRLSAVLSVRYRGTAYSDEDDRYQRKRSSVLASKQMR
jgi:hypothetical protein